jgi:hypothetical protein
MFLETKLGGMVPDEVAIDDYSAVFIAHEGE